MNTGLDKKSAEFLSELDGDVKDAFDVQKIVQNAVNQAFVAGMSIGTQKQKAVALGKLVKETVQKLLELED